MKSLAELFSLLTTIIIGYFIHIAHVAFMICVISDLTFVDSVFRVTLFELGIFAIFLAIGISGLAYEKTSSFLRAISYKQS